MFKLQKCYDKYDVDDYLQNGLFPWLIADSYQNYLNLLGAIRQLAFDHQSWDG
jgi:hypothetical protein